MDVQQVGTSIHIVINNPGSYPEMSSVNPQQAVVIAASETKIFYRLQMNPNFVDPNAQAQPAQQGAQPADAAAFKATPIPLAVTLTPSDNSDPVYSSDPRAFAAAFWE